MIGKAKSPRRKRSTLKRNFVTPEGVDLQLTLGSAGERAGAFLIDLIIMFAILIAASLITAALFNGFGSAADPVFAIIWLLGFFILRNFWFTLFEMGGQGATPGKRLMGLRVVARDGARLSGAAVVTRNALREIEIFLPFSLLAATGVEGSNTDAYIWAALLWSGLFLFLPLFNRDRLRAGDMLAGTWVVQVVKNDLAFDLTAATSERQRTHFTDQALDLYGEFELQTLEDVLRRNDPEAIRIVAQTIRSKLSLPDDGDDYNFLFDYYAALCARLEKGMMLGKRRADKFKNA
ncbi:RDD family protein [Porphyrobacter algicida]|uniref:RDD family protein n=1 Tax=Qipengyuania algicida TaxID=1836209 RepID=A0A845AF71_9SPHN|nr:RDD family protein [Qipengyuania algicida]MXP28890.1 RDD family protein [Qipengyuania algicida]